MGSWKVEPVSERQLNTMRKHRVSAAAIAPIKTKGAASAVITELYKREHQ